MHTFVGASSRHKRHRSRGQSLAEFALILPVFIALVGGIAQFGIIFWAQNTLTQVARDTGRWAVTQGTCVASGALTAQADAIASSSSLIGYTPGQWSGAPLGYPTNPRPSEGVEVAWQLDANRGTPPQPCPPDDNTVADFVTIRLNHEVPVFFPGLQYLPGLGTCTPSGCSISLSSTTQFRMEPHP